MDETKYGWWLPIDVSTHGAKIDQLISVLHWFMLLLFVGWGAFFVYCLIKYRARDGHTAIYAPVKAIATKDVIHGFNIPVLRVKQDTIPGQRIPVWFEATQTGHFELGCAQLCGLGHYRMRADVLIDSPEDFAKWEAENAPPAQEAPTTT